MTSTVDLQVISLAGWVNIMYYIQDVHSFWDWTYFVALIVVWIFFWSLLKLINILPLEVTDNIDRSVIHVYESLFSLTILAVFTWVN